MRVTYLLTLANATERTPWSGQIRPSRGQVRFAIQEIRFTPEIATSKIVEISTILDLRTDPSLRNTR